MASSTALLLGLLALALGASAWPSLATSSLAGSSNALGSHAGAPSGMAGPAAAAAVTAAPVNTSVSVDFAARRPASPLLYGIFFEEARPPGDDWRRVAGGMACSCSLGCSCEASERCAVPPPSSPWLLPTQPTTPFVQIGHAGDGGLYGELVQDRSFDALAAATGFADSSAARLAVTLPPLGSRAEQRGSGSGSCGCSPRAAKLGDCKACGGGSGNNIDIAWHALPGALGARLTAAATSLSLACNPARAWHSPDPTRRHRRHPDPGAPPQPHQPGCHGAHGARRPRRHRQRRLLGR